MKSSWWPVGLNIDCRAMYSPYCVSLSPSYPCDQWRGGRRVSLMAYPRDSDTSVQDLLVLERRAVEAISGTVEGPGKMPRSDATKSEVYHVSTTESNQLYFLCIV